MTNLSGRWKRLTGYVHRLIDLVNVVLTLIGILIVLGLAATVVSFIRGQWLLLAMASAGFVFGIVLLRVVWPAPRPTCSRHKLVLRSTEYEYLTRNTMRHRKTFRVEALADGIDEFRDRFKWTGSGDLSIQPLVSGHIVVGPWSEHAWDFYSIRFPRALRRGDVVETGIVMELEDVSGSGVPVLTTGVYEPTDKLVMRVILPPELRPQEVWLSEYACYTDMTPCKSVAGTYRPASRDIVWEIDKPEMGRKFAVSWTF